MKIYVAFRFTGEDRKILQRELGQICSLLTSVGHEVICTFWKEQHFQDSKFTSSQIMDYSLPLLKSADALLAYIKSAEKSEGMLLEIGYALGNNIPVIAAIRNGVKTNFVEALAKKVISFKDLDDLQRQLPTGFN